MSVIRSHCAGKWPRCRSSASSGYDVRTHRKHYGQWTDEAGLDAAFGAANDSCICKYIVHKLCVLIQYNIAPVYGEAGFNVGNQRCRDLRLPCDGRLDDFRQSLLLSCDEAELAVEFRPGRPV